MVKANIGYVDITFLHKDCWSDNGRFYPASTVEQIVRDMQGDLSRNVPLTNFSCHSDGLAEDASMMTGKVSKVWLEGTAAKARITLFDTSKGNDMAGVIKGGGLTTHSLRANDFRTTSTLLEREGKQVRADRVDYAHVGGIDFVLEPGIPTVSQDAVVLEAAQHGVQRLFESLPTADAVMVEALAPCVNIWCNPTCVCGLDCICEPDAPCPCCADAVIVDILEGHMKPEDLKKLIMEGIAEAQTNPPLVEGRHAHVHSHMGADGTTYQHEHAHNHEGTVDHATDGHMHAHTTSFYESAPLGDVLTLLEGRLAKATPTEHDEVKSQITALRARLEAPQLTSTAQEDKAVDEATRKLIESMATNMASLSDGITKLVEQKAPATDDKALTESQQKPTVESLTERLQKIEDDHKKALMEAEEAKAKALTEAAEAKATAEKAASLLEQMNTTIAQSWNPQRKVPLETLAESLGDKDMNATQAVNAYGRYLAEQFGAR